MDFQMKIMVKSNSSLQINLEISSGAQNTYLVHKKDTITNYNKNQSPRKRCMKIIVPLTG
jgi:DNA polymerase II large subunit